MALSVKNKLLAMIVFLVAMAVFLFGVYLLYFFNITQFNATGNVVLEASLQNTNDNTNLKNINNINNQIGLENLIIVGLGIIVILALAGLALIQMLIRPLDKVIIGTQLVAKGEFPKIEKTSNDEFGRLVTSFNEMVEKLKEGEREEKKAKCIATKEKTKSELIIESMAEGVIVTNKEHKISVFNRAAENIFNIEQKKALGRHILQLNKYGINNIYLDPEIDLKKIDGKIDNKSENNARNGFVRNAGNYNRIDNKTDNNVDGNFSRVYKNIEFKVKHLDKIVGATISPLTDEKDKFCGSVCVLRDITNTKRTDNMKSEFISTVSHELRTPLTSIKGYASLLNLEKFGNINYQQSKAIKVINQESDRLMAIIDQLLDISKLEEGYQLNVQKTKIDECIDNSPALEAAKKKNISVQKNLPNLPKIEIDKNRITDVFTNLICNAVKYSKDGSSIRITAKKRNKNIQFSVIDKGIGIKKDDLTKVFEKFYQAEDPMIRQQGGSGLGLSIVKKIIEMHNGTINIQSEFGHGTTISFMLPLKFKSNNTDNIKK
ncbi:PAS domain-containing protein [Candidatus Woesearchaeota archaeon]|nr:PAS domain-containing protein [Candidatus Woesearchaeota archaeon]